MSWSLPEAQNKFVELIDRAIAEGPQVITRDGVDVAVILPFLVYKKLTTSNQRLGDFLLASPLRNRGLVIERNRRSDLRE